MRRIYKDRNNNNGNGNNGGFRRRRDNVDFGRFR